MALKKGLAQEEIRNSLRELAKTATDEASSGPLEKEKQWKEWEEKFIIYLQPHLGVNGVCLAYVIRENTEPEHGGNFPDVISEYIACLPLNGPYYDADKLTVYNMIFSFTTGHVSGDWIKRNYQVGRW